MINKLAPQGVLYYTDGCHLCDDALILLQECGINFQKEDIISNQILVDRYSVLIPVFKTSFGIEVHWPFNTDQLELALTQK